MSSPRRVLVVGAGGRVADAVLPALASLPERFEVASVRARRARPLETTGGATRHRFDVAPLDDLSRDALAACDMVYVCVAKPAVPEVLARLVELGVGHADLVLDTPVLLFKHLGHRRRLDAFRSVSVSEDVTTLPWLDALRAEATRRALGAPRELLLDRSGYAYHGVALAKTLLAETRVQSARRRPAGEADRANGAKSERTYRLRGGVVARVLDPRDNAAGGFTLTFERGALADREGPGVDAHVAPRFDPGGGCSGFRCGASEVDLAAHEVDLFGPPAEGTPARVFAHMQSCKRVGLARLFERCADAPGEPAAWPLVEGLDDMWIDYFLEKAGRWRATPLTSARSALALGAAGLALRLAGR